MKTAGQRFLVLLTLMMFFGFLFGITEAQAENRSSSPAAFPTVYGGVDYSAVYDYSYYVACNPDVAAYFKNNPQAVLQHFVQYGMKEHRRAKESFDVISYRNAYYDLRAAFGDNWKAYYMHYIQYGQAEKRICTGVPFIRNATTVYQGKSYKLVYDFYYYTQHNPDVLAAFGYDENAVLAHFVNYGMKERRQAKASFDPVSYYNANRDLRDAFGRDWKAYYLHYMQYGYLEGRRTTGVNVLFNAETIFNGVDYRLVYNYNYYIRNNPDVAQVLGTDELAVLQHFVNYGMKEGRQGNKTFNVYSYRLANPDVRAAYGDDLAAEYKHYINYGYQENRKLAPDLAEPNELESGFKGWRPYADRFIQGACYWKGRDGHRIDRIVIHHWGADGQEQSNVVNWFINPDSEASAHYVVSDGLVTQMIQESDTAWHAADREANRSSIGIECHPEKTEGDVETVVNLIANIWHAYGRVLPLTKHSDYADTYCPGRWSDLDELTQKAMQIYLKLEAN